MENRTWQAYRMKVGEECLTLRQQAIAFRKQPTPAEKATWEMLRGHRLMGLKFRRQHPLLGHIIDFYCHELRLCIELDGAPHLESAQKEKDAARDAQLQSMGYRVLRFMNREVDEPEKFKATLRTYINGFSPVPKTLPS